MARAIPPLGVFLSAVPVLMGVAEREMGVRRLLDAIEKEAPDPSLRAEVLGIEPDGPAVAQKRHANH